MNYELCELVDIPKLQSLLDSFYTATGIATGVVSRDGTILTATDWKDMCTKFHRVNPKSQLNCIESDKEIFKKLENGDNLIHFKCKNGLIDLGVPIIVEGIFLAIIFTGQVLFEEPNIDYFKKQAQEFGFDEESYLNALKEIPIVKKEEQEKKLKFLKDLSEMISNLGLKQKKLLEMQDKFKLSEERYKLVVHGSNDGIWDWDFTNKTFYTSDRFLEILGFKKLKINSPLSLIYELIHPDDIMFFIKNYYNHTQNKTSHLHQEVRIKMENNSYKWVLIRGAATWNADNIVIRMAGSLTDLSLQKSSEQLLKEEQDFSNTIINNANAVICILNSDGLLLNLNKYGSEILGYSEKEVLGYKWFNIVQPIETKENLLSRIRSLNLHTNIKQVEKLVVTKNGDLMTILWNYKILLNEDDSIKSIIGIGLDITKKKNVEKRLIEFFSNISHELITPLNIIFSSLQLIDLYYSNNLTCNDNCKLIKHSKSMKQNCYRLLRLVNNLIDITKIDAKYLELNMKKYNIVNLIEDITLSVSEYIENKNLNLTFDTDIEEKFIWCDADRIERIILNLLSNAVKFTKPEGNISVNLYNNKQGITISVKDTGIGIESNNLDTIFERFKQVNKTFIRENEGSGIGLSIVKSLVLMHNGSIKVKSVYGKESEFIIELPINEPNNEQNANYGELLNSDEVYIVKKVNVEFSDIYLN